MTGSRGAIPIQAPHLLKALIRQDANVSRCQLRGGVHLEQGYVNDVCLTPALQPVRLLRGRPEPGVTTPGSAAPRRDLDGDAARTARRSEPRVPSGRWRARGSRPVRDPARPRADPGAPPRARRPAARRCAARSSPARTARAASSRWPGSALRAAGLRVGRDARSRTSSRTASGSRSTAGRSTRRRSPGSSAGHRRPPIGCRARLGDPTEFELLTAVVFRWFAEARRGPRARRGRVWAGGSTRPTPGTAAWPRSRTSTSITPIGSARRSRTSPARRPRSSSAATWRSPGRPAMRSRSSAGARARLGVPLDGRRAGADPRGRPRRAARRPAGGSGRTRVGLRGRHQAANVAVADAILDALGRGRHRRRLRRRPAGAATPTARWPGRLELLTVDGRDVLLDGAHNPAGAAALAAALDDLRPFLTAPAGVTLLTASMADKDVAGVCAALYDSPVPRRERGSSCTGDRHAACAARGRARDGLV